MESLYLLIPIALVFVAIAIKVLFWAVKSGQYDDLDTEAHRILFDDIKPRQPRRDSEGEAEQDAQRRESDS
ncbi:cbb3-type cytochrome oxidase assembly protein CcoS [Exilibacterium tricleocarpae]|uniref:Cbb3-type cytochrome oxidase assembly protein CcoS n=1 Tax=Exilibacterium tricleocarpae TaxID=2591008 RepID=A0A545U5K9_9GAMM|nr:cbb3-type cytochrome oxidase assembly protein CcoS [Exilibacterium tricleocarpae]TQV84746.1 cbb3-type cytochrome oxidase assembly protein CcoS [Exilibacterium tricleocarpae]